MRPRGTVERFGTRPENWRRLYYVYVVEDGGEKCVLRRPDLGPTASLSKRGAQDKLAERSVMKKGAKRRSKTKPGGLSMKGFDG